MSGATTRQQLWLLQHKGYNHQKANMAVSQLYFQQANWAVQTGRTEKKTAAGRTRGKSNAERHQIATRRVTRQNTLLGHLDQHLISCSPPRPPILSLRSQETLVHAMPPAGFRTMTNWNLAEGNGICRASSSYLSLQKLRPLLRNQRKSQNVRSPQQGINLDGGWGSKNEKVNMVLSRLAAYEQIAQ